MIAVPNLGRLLGNALSIHTIGKAYDQQPNLLEPRGCNVQAFLKSGLDKFTSSAFIAPIVCIEGVYLDINREVDPSRSTP